MFPFDTKCVTLTMTIKNFSSALLNLITSLYRTGCGYSDQLKFKHRKTLKTNICRRKLTSISKIKKGIFF
jgi:hypothetical protein